MTDTGLMSAILRWRFEKVQLDGERNGKLIETLVFTQLAAEVRILLLATHAIAIRMLHPRFVPLPE